MLLVCDNCDVCFYVLMVIGVFGTLLRVACLALKKEFWGHSPPEAKASLSAYIFPDTLCIACQVQCIILAF